ncbi:MAG: ribonuclease P protein component [Phycisphaeraceae bacterium]|nr:ribonuclease P protein component [Phycisphaeraceae bacterium]
MSDPTPPSPRPRLTLPAALKLSGKLAYAAVYDHKLKKPIGPLIFHARPNNLPHPRLGLAVSTRVGNAIVRNRVKRLLREAFRHAQHDWPAGYDLIVVVRPHKTLKLAEYQDILARAIPAIHAESSRRQRRTASP